MVEPGQWRSSRSREIQNLGSTGPRPGQAAGDRQQLHGRQVPGIDQEGL